MASPGWLLHEKISGPHIGGCGSPSQSCNQWPSRGSDFREQTPDMNGSSSVRPSDGKVSTRILIAIDVLAILTFAVVGGISHSAEGPVSWLMSAPRIAAPFLVGWGIAAMVFGAYPRAGQIQVRRFATNSILALLVGDLIAFGLRVTVFADTVHWSFALVALASTTIIVVGPRLLYFWAMTSRTVRRASVT